MLKPLSQWICDDCKDVIETPEDGQVFWMQNEENHNVYDFRIVHCKCSTNRKKYDWYEGKKCISLYLGMDGMQYLLALISIGPIKLNGQKTISNPVKIPYNLDEYVDFFRRLQVPYYEEARTLFGHRDIIDTYSELDAAKPYREEELAAIISM